ncbi:MAG: chromate transporter [Treponema sp.]|nr:chromate transporter [Treponema sp.]
MSIFFLYLEFFKIGVFAVGGGLATLPFLFHMAHDRFSFIQQTGWLSSEQVSNFIAIAQCAPGAIGVNVAAQTGYQYGGIAGGLIAVFGLVSPAFAAIAVITRAMKSLKENKAAAKVFSGLRPAATGLLCAASWSVWQQSLYNGNSAAGPVWESILWRESLVCIALFLLIVKFKGHPIIYVALGAAAGILLGF